MTDDTQATTQISDTTATPPQSGGQIAAGKTQANPLDVLEKLLDDIDAGKTGATTARDLAAKKTATQEPAQPTGPTPEEIAAQEKEQQRIEFEQKQAAQQVIDQQKIAEQRQALADEMSNGSANVARATQDEQKQSEDVEKKQAEEGFEVVQLDHTKI